MTTNVRFLLMLTSLFIGGCAALFPTVNSVPQMRQAAQSWPGTKSDPRWSAMVEAQDADLVRMIDENKLLIGLLKLDPKTIAAPAWEPVFGDLILFDTQTGRPLWRYKRQDLPNGEYDIIATKPLIILYGHQPENGATYQGIDPKTGTLVWEHKLQGREIFDISSSGEYIVSLTRRNGGYTLTAWKLATGEQAWKTTSGISRPHNDTPATQKASSPEENAKPLPQIKTDAATIYVIDNHVSAFKLQNGQQKWSIPLPFEQSSDVTTAMSRKMLYVANGNLLIGIDLRRGRILFHKKFPRKNITTIAPANRHLFVVARTKNGKHPRDAVHALHPRTGSIIWQHAIMGMVHSPILATKRRIYYTTSTHLKAHNANTGKLLYNTKIGVPAYAGNLPDRLVIRGRRIIVGRELGVASFIHSNGRRMFARPLADALPLTHEYLSIKLAEATGHAITINQTGNTAAWTGTTGATEAYAQMAQDNLTFALNSPSATSFDRTLALDRAIITERLRQNAAKTRSAVAFGQALGNAIYIYLASEAREARAERASLSVRASIHRHALSIQGNYYLRPFYHQGWGIAIIRLDDGRIARILLTPRTPPLAQYGTNLGLFVLDPEKRLLMTLGVDLNVKAVRTYQSVGLQKANYWQGDYCFWNIPYPSIVAYDLEQLAYTTGGQSHPRKRPTLDAATRALLMAAYRADADAVQKALKSGANINGADAYGHTALMFAAESGRVSIIKTLVKAGADVGKRDLLGRTARIYAAMASQKEAFTLLRQLEIDYDKSRSRQPH